MRRKRKTGFSLLEAAIVLGAVGLVIGSIWMIIESTRNTTRAAVLNQQTTMIINNVRSYFYTRAMPTGASSETTAADFTCTLQNAGVFPEDTCNGLCASCSDPSATPRPFNNYNGTILVNIVNSSPYTTFNLAHAGIDKSGCIRLTTDLSTRAGLVGLSSIRVNSGTTRTSFPLAPATAVTDCTLDSGNSVSLVFTIRK